MCGICRLSSKRELKLMTPLGRAAAAWGLGVSLAMSAAALAGDATAPATVSATAEDAETPVPSEVMRLRQLSLEELINEPLEASGTLVPTTLLKSPSAITIITAEDPRTESLEAIMEEIAAGCREAGREEGQGYWRVGDRREAIRIALNMASPGDLVIISGKGHEQSMCFGATEYPWSDQDITREALAELGYPTTLPA